MTRTLLIVLNTVNLSFMHQLHAMFLYVSSPIRLAFDQGDGKCTAYQGGTSPDFAVKPPRYWWFHLPGNQDKPSEGVVAEGKELTEQKKDREYHNRNVCVFRVKFAPSLTVAADVAERAPVDAF